ncbi:hypothetical protein NDU88_003898 [Pleurodeles waltl]|uniref:Uncharacterized protein n=1 Tax=Pleurodeles waltl TaxID=8319 RepID=A0AAV7SHB7_PLEWA|nr:hypothetical protein NDU88_003898 [Pleurodeles waltl]
MHPSTAVPLGSPPGSRHLLRLRLGITSTSPTWHGTGRVLRSAAEAQSQGPGSVCLGAGPHAPPAAACIGFLTSHTPPVAHLSRGGVLPQHCQSMHSAEPMHVVTVGHSGSAHTRPYLRNRFLSRFFPATAHLLPKQSRGDRDRRNKLGEVGNLLGAGDFGGWVRSSELRCRYRRHLGHALPLFTCT